MGRNVTRPRGCCGGGGVQSSCDSIVASPENKEEEEEDMWRSVLTAHHRRRPGILVLINDADWELEGEEAYEIQNGDNILFVSTLHGG